MDTTSAALSDALGALGELLVTQLRAPSTQHDSAVRVMSLAKSHLAYDEVGISVRGRYGTVSPIACTHPAVEHLERLQGSLGEGPAVHCLSEDADLVVSDVTTDRRWPRWAESAAASGMRALVTVRLHIGVQRPGVMDLYSSTPGSVDEDDLDSARAFAHEAAVLMRVADEVWHLHQAIDRRTVIGQAQGVLMERFEIDADQAFAALKRISCQANRKLYDVASDISARELDPSVALNSRPQSDSSGPLRVSPSGP